MTMRPRRARKSRKGSRERENRHHFARRRDVERTLTRNAVIAPAESDDILRSARSLMSTTRGNEIVYGSIFSGLSMKERIVNERGQQIVARA